MWPFGKSDAQKAQKDAWSKLMDVFGTAKTQAGTLGKKGTANMDASADYWKSILSGDRQKSMAAVGPEASAARSYADASKKQMATMGTGRTGGDVAQMQTMDDRVRVEIETLLGTKREKAAGELGQIGAQEISAMLSALGIGESALTSIGGQSSSTVNAEKQASADMWSSLIKGAVDIAIA